MREDGYESEWLLTDRGETAVDAVKVKLAAESFDCILIGAGIRAIAAMFSLFEQPVNAVHAGAPGARIAFNTSPEHTLEAVQRVAGPASP